MFFESLWLNSVVALGLIVALTFDYVTKFFSYWYVRHIPYKAPVPFIGSDYHRLFGLRNNTTEVNTLYNQYPKDDFVGSLKSRIPDMIVRNPDLIKEVLSTEFQSFKSRGLDLDKSEDICLRNNLFYAEGEKWTLLRERLEYLLNNVTITEDCFLRSLSGINGNTNVKWLLTHLLDDVFQNILLQDSDMDLLKQIRNKFCERSLKDKLVTYIKHIFPSLYVLFGLTTMSKPSKKSLDLMMKSEFSSKIQNIFGFNNKEVLKNIKSTPEDLCFGIISSIVSEGYVPCLNVLTVLLYELAKHPEIQKEARNLSEEYIDAVIKETMRLYPPFSVVSRKCVKTYKFPQSKVLIDKRITMNVPVDALHKDETHYKDADKFIPERFLNDAVMHSYRYLPYGAGPRKCIGEELSFKILRSITKEIIKKYHIETTDKTPEKICMTDHNFGRIITTNVWLRFTPV